MTEQLGTTMTLKILSGLPLAEIELLKAADPFSARDLRQQMASLSTGAVSEAMRRTTDLRSAIRDLQSSAVSDLANQTITDQIAEHLSVSKMIENATGNARYADQATALGYLEENATSTMRELMDQPIQEMLRGAESVAADLTSQNTVDQIAEHLNVSSALGQSAALNYFEEDAASAIRRLMGQPIQEILRDAESVADDLLNQIQRTITQPSISEQAALADPFRDLMSTLGIRDLLPFGEVSRDDLLSELMPAIQRLDEQLREEPDSTEPDEEPKPIDLGKVFPRAASVSPELRLMVIFAILEFVLGNNWGPRISTALQQQTPYVLQDARQHIEPAPGLVARAGPAAVESYQYFMSVSIQTDSTRDAYRRAITRFAIDCEDHGLTLEQIEPHHIQTYLRKLTATVSDATARQHLAAIRTWLGALVVDGVLPTNPAEHVRSPRSRVVVSASFSSEGLPDNEQVRKLFDSFETDSLIDLRDRAILGVIVYGFARPGAVAKLRVADYYKRRDQAWFEFAGEDDELIRVPVHKDAMVYMDEYLSSAGIGRAKHRALFPSLGRAGHGRPTERALTRHEISAMVKRRVIRADLPDTISCRSLRYAGLKNYLDNGGSIKSASALTGLSRERIAMLFDSNPKDVPNVDQIDRMDFGTRGPL